MKKFLSDFARQYFKKEGLSSNGQLTPNFFEEWAKRHMMKPVCIVRDRDGDILLADSGEPVRKSNGDGVDFYRTGYALHRAGLEIGNFNDYPTSDFLFDTKRGGQQKRIDEALAHARQTQQQLTDAGYYDAERKGRFNLQLH